MLYIARFNFDQEQEGKERETGSFEVLVEADSAEKAAEACRPYLTKIVQAQKRDAFAGKVTMHLDDLFEVTGPLARPALINFRVHPADGYSEIGNPFLDGPDQVNPYRWGDPDEEDNLEPFMTFEPAPARIRVAGAKKSKTVKKVPKR